ncbi:CoA-binding protein [Haloferax mucosum ATCC BAA-1512]|uniref:CoA-binding protein n=1 Tax=Haloferax mucosum ATCC BAA-1512 TaxID=662479 RepID=M0IG89_9EURY|nr:CoA-binding protein [Haloferax mucosum]ELZ95800.1 CoA-binding protein [Haloferax mucosum ATCC BAA-1512]
MPVENPDQPRQILRYDRVAVVGASTSYEKTAHIVSAYLQRHGYELRPINPTADEIFGTQAFESLASAPETVDIVDIFRPSENV